MTDTDKLRVHAQRQAAARAEAKAAAMRAETEAILAGTATQQFVHWKRVGAGHYVGTVALTKCYRITHGHDYWMVAHYDESWLMNTGSASAVGAVRFLDGGNVGIPSYGFRTLADAQARAQQHEMEIRQRWIRAAMASGDWDFGES